MRSLAALALAALALAVVLHTSRERRVVVEEVPVHRGQAPPVTVVDHDPVALADAAQVTAREAVPVEASAFDPPTTKGLFVLGQSAALTLTVYEGSRRVRRRMVRLTGLDLTGARSDSDVRQQRAADTAGKVKFIVSAGAGFVAQVQYPDGEWSNAISIAALDPGSQRMQRLEIPRRRPRSRMRLMITSNPSGAPIEGAHVTFSWPDGLLDTLDRRTTDVDGAFTAPWGPELIYHVTADGHSPLDLPAPERRAADGLACPLNRHARMHGVIELPRALRSSPAEVVGRVTTDLSGQGLTSARLMGDGTWSMDEIEIPAGETTMLATRVRATTPSFERQIATSVVLEPGEERVVRDQWESAPPLSVRIQYPDGMQVARGMKVELFPQDRLNLKAWPRSASMLPAVTATTDDDGVASFGRVPRGNWGVRAWPGNSKSLGRTFITSTRTSRSERTVRIAADDGGFVDRDLDHDGRTIVSVTLHGFGPIRGHVQLPSGGPRLGAPVHLRIGNKVVDSAAMSDISGAFVIHLVPLDTEVELLVSRVWPPFQDSPEQLARIVTTHAGASHVVLVADQ